MDIAIWLEKLIWQSSQDEADDHEGATWLVVKIFLMCVNFDDYIDRMMVRSEDEVSVVALQWKHHQMADSICVSSVVLRVFLFPPTVQTLCRKESGLIGLTMWVFKYFLLFNYLLMKLILIINRQKIY